MSTYGYLLTVQCLHLKSRTWNWESLWSSLISTFSINRGFVGFRFLIRCGFVIRGLWSADKIFVLVWEKQLLLFEFLPTLLLHQTLGKVGKEKTGENAEASTPRADWWWRRQWQFRLGDVRLKKWRQTQKLNKCLCSKTQLWESSFNCEQYKCITFDPTISTESGLTEFCSPPPMANDPINIAPQLRWAILQSTILSPMANNLLEVP